MLKRMKESARDTAMFALVGTLFFAYKLGVSIYKFKNWLKKPVRVCLFCDEVIARGNGVDFGKETYICISCARKGQN